MCAISSLVVTAISTAVSMYAQRQQQKAQEKSAKASAEYNAQVAENEAATQQQLAQNEIAKGAADRNRHIRAAQQQQGEMASMLGLGGFEIGSGSNLSLLSDSAEEAQYDANIITQNANMAAWQHQVSATGAENQKSMFDYQGSNAGSGKGNSLLGMGGTLLGGIASGIGTYNAYSGTGGSGSSGTTYLDQSLNMGSTTDWQSAYKKSMGGR